MNDLKSVSLTNNVKLFCSSLSKQYTHDSIAICVFRENSDVSRISKGKRKHSSSCSTPKAHLFTMFLFSGKTDTSAFDILIR